MQLVINSDVCTAHGLRLEDFMLLYCIKQGLLHTEIMQDLQKEGHVVLLGNMVPYNIKNYRLTAKGNKVVEDILNSSIVTEVKTSTSRFDNLATQMCNLFPQGKMPNTKFSWQGSPGVIAIRLKSFVRKFGDFSDEQFLNATKRYVQDYAKQNYQYMQLLKYFIWKDDAVKGMDSQLLTYIQHPEMGTEDTDIGNATLV